MPDLVIPVKRFEDGIIKPRPKTLFERIFKSSSTLDTINAELIKASKTESTINKVRLDADVLNITKTNIDVVNETATTLGKKFDSADTTPIQKLQTTMIENYPKPINEVVTSLKTTEAAIKPDNITTMRDILNTTGETIKTNMDPVISKLEPNNYKDYKSAMDELKTASEQFDKAVNSNDINAIKNAKTNLDRSQAKVDTILESSENLKTQVKSKGQDWGTFKEMIKYSVYLSAMVGTLVGLFFLLPKALTGCYLFKNKGGDILKYKLQGCSDWYDKDANQNYCSCGTKTVSGKEVNPNCDSLPNDKINPYCIGRTTGDTNPRCQFPHDIRYQCNNISDYTKDGAIWYSYQLYTPMSIISDAVNTAANVYESLPSTEDIIKYLIIGGAIFGGLFLLFIIIMLFK